MVNNHSVFMLSVLYFGKLVCSGIFEAKAKVVDFSVLAALYTTVKEG